MAKQEETPFKSFVSKLCEDAEQVVDAVQQISSKFTTNSKVSVQDAVGKTAEVSVAIPSEGMGEIIVSLGRGLQNFPAKSTDGSSFKRGDQVRIDRVCNQQMFVVAVE